MNLLRIVLLLSLFLLPQPVVNAGPVAPATIPCPLDPAPACLKVVVSQDGIYRIAPADLEAAGWDLAAIDPASLGLSSRGRPVAIRVPGEADGRLDSGDFVEFYGQRFRGDEMAEKYSDANVYWLAAGGVPGPRMAEAAVAPSGAPFAPDSFWTTHRAEENHEWYTHHALDWPTRDTWWWKRMTVRGSGDFPLPTQLPAPANEVYSATLKLELGTRNEVGAHHVQARLNGLARPALDVVFSNHQLFRAEADVPGGALLDGSNVLTLTVLTDLAAAEPISSRWSQRLGLDEIEAEAGRGRSGDQDVAEAGLLVAADDLYANYYELRYRRLYQADQGVLQFSSDITATQTFRVGGFASADLLLYEISNPLQPRRLTGFQLGFAGDGGRRLSAQLAAGPASQFLALEAARVMQPDAITPPLLSNVRSPANGADWIVISHGDFLAEAQHLASYRASHDGFRTAAVDVAELYEQFNDGIFHPEAIRRFIAYAVENWQPPAPQYVLLLGDGNWNFKGLGQENYGPPDPNWIPPYLVWADPWQGEVPSDNAFVALDEASPLPSLAIGRLPARTAAEAALMVDKIIAYEAQPTLPFAAWKRRVLYVADNADSSGAYSDVAEAIIRNYLPDWLRPQRVFLDVTHTDPAAATQDIIRAIDDGVSMVTYLGHGSVTRWTAERIWETSKVTQLSNVDRLPLVITLNCLDGYFAHGNAQEQAMAEVMLRYPSGGSVAAWSPAGLGTTWAENILHQGLLENILQNGQRRLGPATMAARQALYQADSDNELLHTMTIFGDPALKLSLPGWQTSLPVVDG